MNPFAKDTFETCWMSLKFARLRIAPGAIGVNELINYSVPALQSVSTLGFVPTMCFQRNHANNQNARVVFKVYGAVSKQNLLEISQ